MRIPRLVIIYDETAAKTLKRETEKLQKKASEVSIKEQAMENLANMQSAANLNLKYKFENFVQGENSKFAYKAAMAVAQNPAGKYNRYLYMVIPALEKHILCRQ